ncbi:hypothetical protein B0H16DRAFT_1482695 [Mycena metata]|uniref:Uncharacterized protein n=1 Tax=Mycena metata TaxID=1033252 RepID=A0AAD7GSI3_9AGAR|nr:hypothetical protein B0H16DRAFT_1482695 [Mycena metata]
MGPCPTIISLSTSTGISAALELEYCMIQKYSGLRFQFKFKFQLLKFYSADPRFFGFGLNPTKGSQPQIKIIYRLCGRRQALAHGFRSEIKILCLHRSLGLQCSEVRGF